MSRSGSLLRVISGMLVVGSLTSTAVERAAADVVGTPVRLVGSGAQAILGELTTWQDTLAGATVPTDVQYFAVGTTDGRDKFLRGESDFVVSAPPFTDAELATQPAGSAAILTVPISVTAGAVVMTSKAAATDTLVLTCNPDDPTILNPDSCITRGVFSGRFRLPPNSLGAFALNIQPEFEGNGLRSWSGPEIVEALGTKTMNMQQLPFRYHTFVNRTEGEAENYYLQDYIKTLAPSAWQMKQREAVSSNWVWEPLREEFPPRWVTSRFGLDTIVGLVSLSNQFAEGGPAPDRWVGNMMLLPSTMLTQVRSDHPGVTYDVVQIKNAFGEWVDPTGEAVTAALAAGGSANIAAHQQVSGGYPLVWINQLSVRSSGLEPDKAAGLAAVIRYLVTDGQDAVVAHGGAALPAVDVTAALKGADRLIEANCPTDTHHLDAGGPGDYEPATPKLAAVGLMLHCVLGAPPAPTTTAPRPTTPRTVPPTPAPAPVTVAAVAETTVETTTTVPETTTTPPPRPQLVLEYEEPATTDSTRSAMPLTLPDDGTHGYRRLGTFLLGAGGFLVARRARPRRRLAHAR